MKLRFLARSGYMVAIPGGHRTGQPARYVGRKLNTETREIEATAKPFELDLEKHRPGTDAAKVFTKIAMRLSKVCRRDGTIIPADQATANYCMVPFVKAERGKDGEWQIVGHVKVNAKGEGGTDWPRRTPEQFDAAMAKKTAKAPKPKPKGGGKNDSTSNSVEG